MKKLSIAAAALAFSATTATAGALVAVQPEPEVFVPSHAYSWTGPYAGLFVGAPTGSNRWSERSINARSLQDDWSGTPWGLMLGYNMQRGNMVFGGEIDFTGGTLSAASKTSPDFGCAPDCLTDVDRLMSLRARAGYAFERTLVYGTVGIAAGRVTGRTDQFGISGRKNRTGWAAGIGIEHAVNDRFTLRAEYIHTDLGRTELPNDCGERCYTDVRFGTIRVGAVFRF